jgi:hypothetical protein
MNSGPTRTGRGAGQPSREALRLRTKEDHHDDCRAGRQGDIWKVGSCYVTCYITGGVLYHIFLLYNMLYGGVT